MKYTTATLGCKVNQFETQAIEAMLAENDFSPVGESETADLIIINTCAVTAESGRKSRQAIRRLKSENPSAICAVCGCYSQLSPEDTAKLGVDVVHGSGNKKHFIDDIKRAVNDRSFYRFIDDPFERRVFEELPGGSVGGRTRAMLKIQDGCVNFCTYCIIPYTRGRLRSLPVEACAQQTKALVLEGYNELVVTGIEVASYGRDLKPTRTLADAVEAIAGNAGDMRVRLGSLEPTVVNEEFCSRLAATGKVCNHFHLSLQSGCDGILDKMNRKYDTAQFYESATLLRKYFPDCGLTADLIVGFPGESEEQHKETLEFIKKCNFSAMHIFPYSIRPGTKAAEMKNQLTHAVKSERASSAKAVADAMEKEYLISCIGKVLPVIFETEHDGKSMGHASNYAQVCADGGHRRGLVENVEIFSYFNKMLVGKVV